MCLGLGWGTWSYDDAYLLCVPEKVCFPSCEGEHLDWISSSQCVGLYE